MSGRASTDAPPLPHEGLAALSDPVRWRTVELLAGGERCVCDLESATGVAQSRLSYHLGVLRNAGMITARREGRWVYYALSPEGVGRLADALTHVLHEWTRRGATAPPARCE